MEWYKCRRGFCYHKEFNCIILHLRTTVERPLIHVPGSFIKAVQITASSSYGIKIFLNNVQLRSQDPSLLSCPANGCFIVCVYTSMYTLQITQEIVTSFASKRLCKQRTKGVMDIQDIRRKGNTYMYGEKLNEQSSGKHLQIF